MISRMILFVEHSLMHDLCCCWCLSLSNETNTNSSNIFYNSVKKKKKIHSWKIRRRRAESSWALYALFLASLTLFPFFWLIWWVLGIWRVWWSRWPLPFRDWWWGWRRWGQLCRPAARRPVRPTDLCCGDESRHSTPRYDVTNLDREWRKTNTDIKTRINPV